MAFNYWQKFEGNGIYHIYNRAVGGKNLFEQEDDYRYFLGKLDRYLFPYVSLYAFCLMPNHFHLLVKISPFEEMDHIQLNMEKSKATKRLQEEGPNVLNTFLEDQMRRLFSSYALYYNHKYQVRGALFQKRFKRVQFTLGQSILAKMVYIHHNPIHHGYTENYEDWAYSSYHAYVEQMGSQVNTQEIMNWLGDGNLRLGFELFQDFHRRYKFAQKEPWQID